MKYFLFEGLNSLILVSIRLIGASPLAINFSFLLMRSKTCLVKSTGILLGSGMRLALAKGIVVVNSLTKSSFCCWLICLKRSAILASNGGPERDLGSLMKE